MKNTDVRQRVIELVELARTESERHLSNYSAEEIESFRGMDLLDELLEMLASAETQQDKNLALEKRIVAEGLHAAVMIRDIIAVFDQRGGPEHMDPWSTAGGAGIHGGSRRL